MNLAPTNAPTWEDLLLRVRESIRPIWLAAVEITQFGSIDLGRSMLMRSGKRPAGWPRFARRMRMRIWATAGDATRVVDSHGVFDPGAESFSFPSVEAELQRALSAVLGRSFVGTLKIRFYDARGTHRDEWEGDVRVGRQGRLRPSMRLQILQTQLSLAQLKALESQWDRMVRMHANAADVIGASAKVLTAVRGNEVPPPVAPPRTGPSTSERFFEELHKIVGGALNGNVAPSAASSSSPPLTRPTFKPTPTRAHAMPPPLAPGPLAKKPMPPPLRPGPLARPTATLPPLQPGPLAKKPMPPRLRPRPLARPTAPLPPMQPGPMGPDAPSGGADGGSEPPESEVTLEGQDDAE